MRKLAKGVAWVLGACGLLLGAWLGINATDEALSGEARAMLVVAPLPAPDRGNGYLDYLVLAAPADVPTFEAGLERLKALNNQSAKGMAPPPWPEFRRDERVPRCDFGAAAGEPSDAPRCFEAALRPEVGKALDAHAVLLERYRTMRDKPRFVSLFEPKSPEDQYPAYHEMLEAQRMVLLAAAWRFQRGDRAGAIGEVERDAAFYRRMARDATTLIDKMIAFVALDREALLVAEMARHTPRGEVALWRRLESLVAPLSQLELDVVPTLSRDFASTVKWGSTRDHARLSDATWEVLVAYAGETRPWWEPVAPYFYRPHQTVNRFAASCRLFLAIAERPSTEFFDALATARKQAASLDPGPIYSLVVNPAGWRHPLIGSCQYADYVARSHGRAGVQTLARLIVKLRASGISKPEDVAKALAGPLGKAHADPFSGEPMRFDPANGTVGFDILNEHLSGVAREVRQRYGRMALRL